MRGSKEQRDEGEHRKEKRWGIEKMYLCCEPLAERQSKEGVEAR
jgi:hypothetical protein